MLYEAERTRVAIEPLTDMDDSLDIDDAYAIQLANIDRVVKEGQIISGKKIGLTSEGIQKQLGVNEPDYGHLFESMNCPDGSCRIDDLISARIEGEIAFILKDDLKGGNVTAEDVRKATAFVVPAFEIVDSRVVDWRIKLIDTVSDNASSGRYVLSDTKWKIDDVDLPNVEMKLYKNGELVNEGKGSAVLGDPAEAVAWLSNKLWGYGVALLKDEVILSGALSATVTAEKGDEFMADFGEFGKVKACFV
ncbi:MAG: fumarylacetoacetate hydrolase family protein [Mogibacterium sp.]|nr:fumarylacetoacetate hydrolase family protein [Mogibacterium sp.]